MSGFQVIHCGIVMQSYNVTRSTAPTSSSYYMSRKSIEVAMQRRSRSLSPDKDATGKNEDAKQEHSNDGKTTATPLTQYKPGLRGALPDLNKNVPALMPNAEYVKFRLTHAALLGPLNVKPAKKKKSHDVHKTSSSPQKDKEKDQAASVDVKTNPSLKRVPSAPQRENERPNQTPQRATSAQSQSKVEEDVVEANCQRGAKIPEESPKKKEQDNNNVVTSTNNTSNTRSTKAETIQRTSTDIAHLPPRIPTSGVPSTSSVRTSPGDLTSLRKSKDSPDHKLSFFDQAMKTNFSAFNSVATNNCLGMNYAHQAIDNYGLFASVAQRSQCGEQTSTSTRSSSFSAFDPTRYSYKASSAAFMEKVQEKMNEPSRRLETKVATPSTAQTQRPIVSTKNVHRIMFNSTYPSDRQKIQISKTPTTATATATTAAASNAHATTASKGAKAKGSLFGTKTMWIQPNTNVMRTSNTHQSGRNSPGRNNTQATKTSPTKALEKNPPN